MSKPTAPPVASVVTEYLTLRRGMGRSAATLLQERSVLERFAREVSGGSNPRMARITVQDLQDYLYASGGLVDSGMSPGTHNNHLQKIRGLFSFALSRGYVKAQIVTVYNGFDRQKETKRERYRPAPTMLGEMLAVASNPRDRFFIALAINTMGRAGELTPLRIGDLNLDSGTIAYTVYKTKQTDSFPMTEDLSEEVSAWLSHYASAAGRSLRDEDYLVPRLVSGKVGQLATGERLYRPDLPITHPHRIVQQLLAATGRDDVKGEGVHTVRRAMARATFDMLAEQGGVDSALETVSAMLHHSSVTMTERYLGVEARRMKRDRALLGQPLLKDMIRKDAASKVTRMRVETRRTG